MHLQALQRERLDDVLAGEVARRAGIGLVAADQRGARHGPVVQRPRARHKPCGQVLRLVHRQQPAGDLQPRLQVFLARAPDITMLEPIPITRTTLEPETPLARSAS